MCVNQLAREELRSIKALRGVPSHKPSRGVAGEPRLEMLMPQMTVVSPATAVPLDRLTLGAAKARAIVVAPTTAMCTGFSSVCMADD